MVDGLPYRHGERVLRAISQPIRAIFQPTKPISLPTRAISGNTTDIATNSSDIATNTTAISGLNTKYEAIKDVEDLMDYVSVNTSSDVVRFDGANVQIVSGSGTTNGTVNGLGNLIVGYDEAGSISSKTGSHNIVVG